MKIKKPYFQNDQPAGYGEDMFPKIWATRSLLKYIRHLLNIPDNWTKFGYLSSVLISRAMKYFLRESLLPELGKRIDSSVSLYEMAYKKDSSRTIRLFVEVLHSYVSAQERIYFQRRRPSPENSYVVKADNLITEYVDAYETQFGTLISMVVGCRRIYTGERLPSGAELVDMDTSQKVKEIENSIIPTHNPISLLRLGVSVHLRNSRQHGSKIEHDPEKQVTTIRDRRNYTEKFSLRKIQELLDQLFLSIDAIEISWTIFQMNHFEEVNRSEAWNVIELTKANIEAIVSEAADEYGFEFLEGEDADEKTLWLLLKRKSGTFSREAEKSEVLVGYGNRGVKFPLEIPAVEWNTRDQILGFISRIASLLLNQYSSVIVEMEEGNKRKKYLKVEDLHGFIDKLQKLSNESDREKANNEAKTTVIITYVKTNISD